MFDVLVLGSLSPRCRLDSPCSVLVRHDRVRLVTRDQLEDGSTCQSIGGLRKGPRTRARAWAVLLFRQRDDKRQPANWLNERCLRIRGTCISTARSDSSCATWSCRTHLVGKENRSDAACPSHRPPTAPFNTTR